MTFPYTISNDTVTVVWNGKPVTTKKGTPNFLPLRDAIIDERWSDVPKYLNIAKSLEEWAKGRFALEGQSILYDGECLPQSISDRMFEMASRGEDPSPLFKFWERLAQNPSYRSVKQLWPFLQHQGIPLTEDGCFLAYKAVRDDYRDAHSGKFDNHPGQILKMPRNKISDDPNTPCHEGFHVGARGYASTFHSGGRLLICKVDPVNVVCIPYDSGAQKMRVCEYQVIGLDNGDYMPSTTISNDEIGTRYSTSHSDNEEIDEDAYIDEDEDDVFVADAGDSYDDEYDPFEVKHPETDLNVPLSLTYEEKKILDEARDVIGVIKRIRDRRPGTGLREAKVVVDAYLSPASSGRVVDLMEPKDIGYIVKRKAKKGYAKLDKLDSAGLMKQSIEDLREYAGKGLSIVGASKIPGGKAALVAKILEIRE